MISASGTSLSNNVKCLSLTISENVDVLKNKWHYFQQCQKKISMSAKMSLSVYKMYWYKVLKKCTHIWWYNTI